MDGPVVRGSRRIVSCDRVVKAWRSPQWNDGHMQPYFPITSDRTALSFPVSNNRFFFPDMALADIHLVRYGRSTQSIVDLYPPSPSPFSLSTPHHQHVMCPQARCNSPPTPSRSPCNACPPLAPSAQVASASTPPSRHGRDRYSTASP